MKTSLTLIAAWMFSLLLHAQTDLLLIRYPALNPDGSQLAFSYQGDIWTVAAGGGPARRLTIHESYESHPRWSPDGKKIVFQGNRLGNDDLFMMDAGGSKPQRLTFYSGSDGWANWTPNGQLLFNSRRFFASVERISEIYSIPAAGGTPQRFLDALGDNPAASPDGRYIAFERGSCRVVREAYRGPANRDIWVYDTQTKQYTQITKDEGQDIYPDWGPGNSLYFLSARNGRYNLYKSDVRGSNPQAVTSFKDEGIRYYDLSANGKKIVLERGAGIYTLAADGGRPGEVTIQVPGDYRFDPEERKNLTADASEFALSPNGQYLAFSVRGELFVYPEDKDKKRANRITDTAAREQDVAWVNDSTMVFLSDRNGNRDLFMARAASQDSTDLYRAFRFDVKALTQGPEEEGNFVLSPDQKQIAFMRGRGQLIVANIDPKNGLSNQRTLLNGWDTPGGVSWSPDSKWLAYSLDDLNFNTEIYIHPVDQSREPVNVSLHPRRDFNPTWSKDGSKLAFLSDRNNGDADVWFVWLKEADWEKTTRDWEEDDDSTTSPEKKEKKDTTSSKTVKSIQIDFDDIHERLIQVTNLPGNEGDLMVSHDGETFYYSINGGGRQGQAGKQAFMSTKWDGSETKTIFDDKALSGLTWDPKGKELYYLERGGRISKINPESKKVESLAFQASMKINYAAERQEIFDDAWRAMRDGFYDPKFHGQDWKALRSKYEARALAASTQQDFRDMFNEMLGQLNASHMGMYGSNPEETQNDRTGLLGVEVSPVAGGVRVDAVIPGSPADRESSKLQVGEVITAINGVPIADGENFYALLNGTADERTLVSVRGNGRTRELVIRPAGSLRDELYEAWVDQRKALTDRYSGGKLGYIHIQGMNWPSFERFERELTASGYGKEGIVIDVRFNGGGWTTDMLMAVLSTRQHSYTVPRGAAADLSKENKKFVNNYPFGERLPFPALTMPSVALCNETSYSNAEIFSHAYKTLGFGKLVGVPTFGAVISTGAYTLLDGSYVRMPYRGWYVKATGENMEHGPAVPDYIINNQPEDKGNNEDPQLKKAVEVLLQGGK